MKTFSTRTIIRSTPEAIWRILTDAPGYPSWDSTYTKIDGTIAPGETITLHHANMDPPVLTMKVSEFEPNQRMVWCGGGMPEAVFKGERIFMLSSPEAGKVDFSMQLVFSGMMAPLLTRTLPDLQPQIDQFAAALKKQAEACVTHS